MLLLIQYTLIFASVLLLVALGGCFSEHSGVINIGLEGIMVMGALGGALMMKYLPSDTPAAAVILLVMLASLTIGMLYSLLLAVAAIQFKADQTLVGTAMNMLGTAAATVIVRAINSAENPDNVSSAIQYIGVKKAFLVKIGSFEFNWFMLVALIALIISYTVPVSDFVCEPAENILRQLIPWESTYTKCAMQVYSSQAFWAALAELSILLPASVNGNSKMVWLVLSSWLWRL